MGVRGCWVQGVEFRVVGLAGLGVSDLGVPSLGFRG